MAAARASWFALPVTKLSKLNPGLRRARSSECGTLAWTGDAGKGVARTAPSAPRASTSFKETALTPSSEKSFSMRPENRSRTSSSTNRFGAASVRLPASEALPSTASGRIQVLNCCAGSSRSRRRKQASQRFCMEVIFGVSPRGLEALAPPGNGRFSYRRFYSFRG